MRMKGTLNNDRACYHHIDKYKTMHQSQIFMITLHEEAPGISPMLLKRQSMDSF